MKSTHKNCWNCKHYEEEIDEGTTIEYCRLFDCELCEIAGLNSFQGCEAFDGIEED